VSAVTDLMDSVPAHPANNAVGCRLLPARSSAVGKYPILERLRQQIFGVGHDLERIDLAELLQMPGYSEHSRPPNPLNQGTGRCSGKPVDVAHVRLPLECPNRTSGRQGGLTRAVSANTNRTFLS
jgi:hypothetical protein